MSPVSARRRAWRAMLSAVAGGGLTAAGLGGPLAGAALGAGTQAPLPVTSEGAQATAPAATAPEATATSTQPASTTTSTAPAAPPATTTPTAPTSTGTLPQPASPSAPRMEAPKVVLQRRQEPTTGAKASPTAASTKAKAGGAKGKAKATGASNVAGSPQSVAEAGALAAILASSEASAQALAFYRIPLFLLPIYKAAAVQYGVPWQILAAINEIETDYGTDLSVSTAGAVGWMQFMPSTWLQYGVDALNAGYADPYNPVDAIFAAARYLRAAGAASDLRAAIFSYNHSEEYVDSVLLRAKLISTYPKEVIATLTGLIDGRLPVTGTQVAWGPLAPAAPSSSSSATANAAAAGAAGAGAAPAAAGEGAAGAQDTGGAGAATSSAGTQGSAVAPAPGVAAAGATSAASVAAQQGLQLVSLTSSRKALVVAVQNGKIVKIGQSRKLGRYLELRDVYGDVFTYAGLGSIAPTYTLPSASAAAAKSPAVEAASTPEPQPTLPASAGTQPPLTLSVKSPLAPGAAAASAQGGAVHLSIGEESGSATAQKVRLFAHPGNPDARAAAAASAASAARRRRAEQRIPLRSGSVVATGTVLGHVLVGAKEGHMRFAIRPAGDPSTIDPGPILSNWAQLQEALHPRGAAAANALLGATASDVFLMSKSELERAVLSDPGIEIHGCARDEVASGAIDRRVLAVLTFLSRSGLRPTVSALRCGQGEYAESGARSAASLGDAVRISAINGTPIAKHQGAGTITDLTIRTLLTLPAGFVPHEIDSLMRYPEAPRTHAQPAHWNNIELVFQPAPSAPSPQPAATARVAHSARSGNPAPSPLATTVTLGAAQWNQLMTRVAALQMPTIATKPSSAAIPDRKRPGSSGAATGGGPGEERRGR